MVLSACAANKLVSKLDIWNAGIVEGMRVLEGVQKQGVVSLTLQLKVIVLVVPAVGFAPINSF